MPEQDKFKVERVLSVGKISDQGKDLEYWLTKTPEERLDALELLRQLVYGDKASERLQRVIEVVQRKRR